MLADYDPLSERELGLRQMDQVDLLKTGCAGWWFVQLVRPPYSQVKSGDAHIRDCTTIPAVFIFKTPSNN